jgi:hypothetical protein
MEYIKTDAQNLLLHVSALDGCLHPGVLTMVKRVLSKSTTITHLYTYSFTVHATIKQYLTVFILYQKTNHSSPSVVFGSEITERNVTLMFS